MTLMIKASSHLQPVFVDKHQSYCLLQQAEKQNICRVQDCEKKRAYWVSQVCKATPNCIVFVGYGLKAAACFYPKKSGGKRFV